MSIYIDYRYTDHDVHKKPVSAHIYIYIEREREKIKRKIQRERERTTKRKTQKEREREKDRAIPLVTLLAQTPVLQALPVGSLLSQYCGSRIMLIADALTSAGRYALAKQQSLGKPIEPLLSRYWALL